MRPFALFAAIAFVAPAAAADIAAGDKSALDAALSRAAPGDRVLLAPGAYGDLALGPRRGKGAVTLAAADPSAPPVFRSILLRDAEEVTLDGLAVVYGVAADPLAQSAVEVRRSSSIRLQGMLVSSADNGVAGDDAYGVFIRDSRAVTIAESTFTDLFRGVAAFDSVDVAVSGNRFFRIGSDGVVARGAVGLSVENNRFTDFTPADPARWHPDAVQLWSRGAARANERIVIRGNIIRRGDGGATQGVFIKSPEIASRSILIEGNTIDQSMGQGIFVQNGVDVTIRNNLLSAAEPVIHPPAVEVRAPFEGAVVEDNDAPKFRLPAGVAARGNRISP